MFDTSKYDLANYGDNELFEEIRKENLKDTNDALIGVTAIKQGMVLVTEDLDLKSKVCELDGIALSFKEFKVEYL